MHVPQEASLHEIQFFFTLIYAMGMASEPPFKKVDSSSSNSPNEIFAVQKEGVTLPMIDLSRLNSGEIEHERCVKELAEAAREWGFFQVVNHGVPPEVLETMYEEGRKVFDLPFSEKSRENFMNLPKNCYRWGNPDSATLLKFNRSEALQIHLPQIPSLPKNHNFRVAIEACVHEMRKLAQMLCELLGKEVNVAPNYFEEKCKSGYSHIRINKYPPRPLDSEVFGLIAHTDSNFLTVLSQDQIGGLELKKDGRWIAVKPHPEALVINVGDLLQALSNGVYKSILHRVVSPQLQVARFSVGLFYNPGLDMEIECIGDPKLYRTFTLREYYELTDRDVRAIGDKVGLPRFLIDT